MRKKDVNFAMNKYLSKIDSLLDAHAPFKKLLNNFITTIIRTLEIFNLHSSKGLKKSISQTSSMKTSKI